MEDCVALIKAEGREGLAVPCDVTDEAQIEALFAAATEKYGNVDIAVFSAGTFCEVDW